MSVEKGLMIMAVFEPVSQGDVVPPFQSHDKRYHHECSSFFWDSSKSHSINQA